LFTGILPRSIKRDPVLRPSASSWLALSVLSNISEGSNMRTLVASFAMIAGGVIFAGDPSKFSRLDFSTFPGTMVVGSALFLCGILLWLQGTFGSRSG
jgi:hypothetical protein